MTLLQMGLLATLFQAGCLACLGRPVVEISMAHSFSASVKEVLLYSSLL
jgi:hypothetical protein